MLDPDCLRGDAFIQKYAEDCAKLLDMGFPPNEVRYMMGAMTYVHDAVDTPEWLRSAPKLPKGYKWSMGVKYHYKGKHMKSDGKTYTLLDINGDLYIRNMLQYTCFYRPERDENGELVIDPKTHIEDHVQYKIIDDRICVIPNWRSHPYYEIDSGLYGVCASELLYSLQRFWEANGGYCGLTKPILKDPRHARKERTEK